jgi:hypothetical protein
VFGKIIFTWALTLIHTKLWSENQQERDHMVYLDMDGRETLKWALL